MGDFGSRLHRGLGTRGRFHLRSLGALLALWALGFATPALAQGTFAYRKSIQVIGGAGGLVGGPHRNFPLLVSLPNDASLLARVAAGGKDIMFRGEDDTTCGGVGTSPCLLSHEIERYDSLTGTLVAWVRVPSVNAGTVIYMYYGNALITADTETPASVWDTRFSDGEPLGLPGYVGVWHLGETASAAVNWYRDSSAFANHGRGGRGVAAAVPARVNGQIGFAQNFSNGDLTYDFVDDGSDGTLNISGNAITLQAWVRHNIVVGTAHGTPASTTVPYGILAHKGYFDGYSLWLYGTDDNSCPGSDTKPCVIFNLPGRSFSLRTNMTTGPSAGAWHHIVGTYDGATMTVYQDGAVVTTLAKTGSIAPSSAEPEVYIGHGDLPENVGWSGQFEGDIDEVRVSNVSRSANWILTEYNNQAAPASFYVVGGEDIAGGPWALTPITVNYRSIGIATAYVTGTVSATNGSVVVDGTGTAWRTANRGRGDRVTIDGVDYTVLAVDFETRLRMTSPFTGTTGSGKGYVIARKFNAIANWESCISFAAACAGVLSASLVADNRSEVGIFYYDAGGNPLGSPVLTIDGSTTDAAHTITLTVDPGNRHPGRGAASQTWAAFGNSGTNPTIRVYDDYVTVEWLDLLQFIGGSANSHGIEINNLSPANHIVVRYNVIHGRGDGIRIADADAVVDIYDNVIYETNYGIHLPTNLNAAARVDIFNNTIYSCNAATGPSGIKSDVRQTTQRVDLRNNIVHSNANGDIGVAPPFDRAWFCNPGCTQIGGTGSPIEYLADGTQNYALNFTTAGTDCLYVGSANPFRGLAFNPATGGVPAPSPPAPFPLDLQWDYWNGAWVTLETTPFSDGTFQLQWAGFVYWSDDPTGWLTTTVGDATSLYYVRACLASGSYTTPPTERQIVRADVSVAGNSNLTSDQTAAPHGPRGGFIGGQNGVPLANVAFVNTGSEDLHLQGSSWAVNGASSLARYFIADIDAAFRISTWDIGADELNGTTAVRLMSFAAVPGNTSVTLEWRTGSELSNLGFHVYRGPSADGPWTRLTSSLIPGLGSSPLGQAYSWLDAGLVNGVRYYYRLEDVDTSSVSTFHGPVSAVPEASVPAPPGGGGGGEPGRGTGPGGLTDTSCPSWVLAAAPDAVSPTCTKHGDPESVSLDVLSRDASSATLELRTGGFWALHTPGADGLAGGREPLETVRIFVPGFDFPTDARAPGLPLRRALVDAVVGKQVKLVSAEAYDLRAFRGLRPSAVGLAEMSVSRDGTVRPARRALSAPVVSRGYVPGEVARLAGTVFQGEKKSAVVELTPVRFSGSGRGLVLAGRVRVKLGFTGVAEGESGSGSRGRALPRRRALFRETLAQLHTSRRGLHAVSYEALFPQRPRGFSTSFLRLQRQEEVVPFHVEPAGPVFGPGSVLYFFADRTASSTDYSREMAYELVRASGREMGVVLAHPLGAPAVSSSTGFASFETNRIYQAGLLEAPDIWLWDAMASGVAKTKPLTLSGVDTASGEMGRLGVQLQGGSESGVTADHHVRLSVNGGFVGEATFAGKQAHRVDMLVPASLLREGANELAITNVGDTGVSSLVFLDRFEVSYPQASTVRGGVFEGVWGEGGTAEVSGLSGSPIVLDVTGAATADPSSPDTNGAPRDDTNDIAGTSSVKWVTGYETAPGVVRFEAEAGRRYVVVSPEGVLAPRVGGMVLSTLRDRTNQADYLVIGPGELLEAAGPLLERRRSQGLVSRAVSFEEIASEFGKGQPSAEAIRSFLTFAYHSWQRPSPQYVLLLGDATYDPQRFLSTSWTSPLPALWAKTSYLWTVSDPALAAVNGEDLLPDLSIGRLPATTREEAEKLVGKLLAWEDSGQGLSGNAVLVADDPDQGGDFEADVEDIRASFLAGRSTTTLKLSELGSGTRPAILGAFDDGASLMSYVGHGGSAVWASENVLNSWDVSALQAQSRQPLLLTLNCLNGYFVAPNFDALSEAFLKAEGRGAVAAFSPSGLSLDGPAHPYHRAVMKELTSGTHERLGDAIVAAQRAYAQTGLMPELLSVYQLLGDPAMKVR